MVELDFAVIRSRIQYPRGDTTPVRQSCCIICRTEPRHHFFQVDGRADCPRTPQYLSPKPNFSHVLSTGHVTEERSHWTHLLTLFSTGDPIDQVVIRLMSSLAFLVTELQVCRIPLGSAAPCPSASYLSLQVLGQRDEKEAPRSPRGAWCISST
jgi:hypothetical protein